MRHFCSQTTPTPSHLRHRTGPLAPHFLLRRPRRLLVLRAPTRPRPTPHDSIHIPSARPRHAAALPSRSLSVPTRGGLGALASTAVKASGSGKPA